MAASDPTSELFVIEARLLLCSEANRLPAPRRVPPPPTSELPLPDHANTLSSRRPNQAELADRPRPKPGLAFQAMVTNDSEAKRVWTDECSRLTTALSKKFSTTLTFSRTTEGAPRIRVAPPERLSRISVRRISMVPSEIRVPPAPLPPDSLPRRRESSITILAAPCA
ncbi:MAG: hypothetical protein GY898_16735 [Proteobacteria bacterium]|nr:hypothetical protein [Pseudomonadota bacterium]